MVRRKTKEYSRTKSKEEKSAIVTDLADAVRRSSPDGGFVKQDARGWYEVGSFLAREKISQAFRDVLHYRYKSSTNSRRRSRQAQKKSSKIDTSSKDDANSERDKSCWQSPGSIDQDDSSGDDAQERFQETMMGEHIVVIHVNSKLTRASSLQINQGWRVFRLLLLLQILTTMRCKKRLCRIHQLSISTAVTGISLLFETITLCRTMMPCSQVVRRNHRSLPIVAI